MFCIYLRTNSDLCHLQHKLIGFYNRDEKCLQRGTDWVFKYNGLDFVLNWLIVTSTFQAENKTAHQNGTNVWSQLNLLRPSTSYETILFVFTQSLQASLEFPPSIATLVTTWFPFTAVASIKIPFKGEMYSVESLCNCQPTLTHSKQLCWNRIHTCTYKLRIHHTYLNLLRVYWISLPFSMLFRYSKAIANQLCHATLMEAWTTHAERNMKTN